MKTFYMIDNTGRIWKEKKYKGFGVFGGKDYYELLAEMNGFSDRIDGIDIESDLNRNSTNTLYPNLVENKNTKWKNEQPETASNQGLFPI
jgi:hypothetical protein